MPKQNCKYWDKCYQRNEIHLQKYNHPETTGDKVANEENQSSTETETSDQESKNFQDTDNMPDKYETASLREEAMAKLSGKNYMARLQNRIKLSEQKEYDNLVQSNEFIRHKFLVEMPPDFYDFWKLLQELNPKQDGQEILLNMEKQFQLQLVGPFEFIAGKFQKAKIREPGDYLRHWRFFYDPPEFQTLFVRKSTGIHYGYWRDSPKENDNLLLARNDSRKNCEFVFIAGNIFEAFFYYLDKDFTPTPFTATIVVTTKKALQKFAEVHDIALDSLEKLRKKRNSKVVCKTFHRAGIVVPYDRKTQVGYRPLIESDSELKKILKIFEAGDRETSDPDDRIKTAVMEKLNPIAVAANIAVDECDFGTALELGIDLFCSGHKELHMLIQTLLVQAYSLLHRPQFIAIAKAHLEKRNHNNLSIFDLDN
uniref:PBZ-type domain-containing protein n=1 Tax=Glossina morsitans morsitans TaxID=37546 RepID=A0A1B0G9I4_GLOMM